VDNHARTAEYLTRRDTCLADLKTVLAEALHGKTRPTLEIGCGHGHYLTAYAAAHPEAFCVGIDLLKDRIARAERKRNRARLANLVFIQAEAADLLKALPSGVALANVFILFPDPWPKRRHHKNRIIQPDFLSALAEASAPGAHLYFRTDYGPYFEDAHRTVSSHGRWQLKPTDSWPFELETVFQSRADTYQSLIARRTTAAVAKSDMKSV
jgi:tRNA (guanine-N7-)-methyltransferase